MAPQLETIADAVAHYQANRLEAAERICRQTLSMMGHHPDALHLLGIVSARLGNHDVAIDCFNRLLAAYPNWAEVHGNLGNVLREQGKLDEAEVALRRALQLQPHFAPAYNNLGAIYKVRRNRDMALACFRRAVDYDPNCFVAIYNLGIVASNQGRFDEAAACLRRALQLKPDFAAARCALANQLQQMCQWDELPSLAQGVTDAVENNRVCEGLASVSPFFFMALPTITTAEQQRRCVGSPGTELEFAL